MRLKLTRNWPRSNYIIGRFYIEGEYFSNSLEPAWKDNARYTAIPPGIYEVIMSYSPKFKRVLPLLRNVPGRDSITAAARLGTTLGQTLSASLLVPSYLS